MHRPGRIRSNRWYDVANACRKPTTLPQIADNLGTTTGSLQALIRSMEDEDLLESDPKVTYGRTYKTTKRGRRELASADEGRTLGAQPLARRNRLVLIGEGIEGVPPDTLRQIARDPAFLGAVRLEGQVRWLCVFEDDAAAVDRTQRLCGDARAPAYTLQVDRILGRGALVEYADSIETPPREISQRD
jgi:DNA-binding MarR family transcriptional regulator